MWSLTSWRTRVITQLEQNSNNAWAQIFRVYAWRLALEKAETHGSIHVLRKSYDNPTDFTNEFQAEPRSDFKLFSIMAAFPVFM